MIDEVLREIDFLETIELFETACVRDTVVAQIKDAQSSERLSYFVQRRDFVVTEIEILETETTVKVCDGSDHILAEIEVFDVR